MRALASAPAAPVVPGRTSTERDSDTDLVARVRAGEDAAFERLYERYHRRIAAYIYGMVQDYGRAEDIAQDVFLSALRRMRETERPIAFKPWAYEIAKNACIDQFRRSRRAEEVSYDAEEGLGAADYGKLVQGGPSPEAAVDQKLSLDHLRGAFSGLSQTHHEILVMRELEGLSYREIGERLGMSRPSVESTLFRARRRLSEEYEELITGERCLRVQQIISMAATGALGARDGRKLAAHVSHCQPCRRHAKVAGVDDALLVRPGVAAKIAAFLPLPAFLKRRWDVSDASGAGGVGTSWVANAAPLAGYAEPALGWVKAAAVAATVAAAGVGAGHVTTPGGVLDRSGDDRDRAGQRASASSGTSSSTSRASSKAARGGTAASAATGTGTGTGTVSGAATRAAGGATTSTASTATTPAAGAGGGSGSAPAASSGASAVSAPSVPADAGADERSSDVGTLATTLDPTKQPNGARPAPPQPSSGGATGSGTGQPSESAPAVPTVTLPGTLGEGGGGAPDPVGDAATRAGTAVTDALGGP